MEFFLPDSHRVILELTLGEGEEEPDDSEAGWQKGTEGPEKPEGKVTKRSAQEQMKTRLDLFRAWRFTEEIKDSMVPLAERGGENEDGIGTPGVQVRSGIFGAPKAQLRAFPLSILSPGVRERKSISAPSRDQAARSCEDNQAEQAIGKPFIKAKQETSLLCCYTGGQKSEMPLSVSGVSSCISPHPSPSPYRAAPQTLLLPNQPNRTLGPRNWRKWRADMRVHP